MTHPTDNPLLTAVDKLSAPRKTSAIQMNAAGITCTSTIHHEPLLARLRAAVVGGIGSHAGSSLGNERIPFDAHALELYDCIEAKISEWFVNATSQPVYLTPEQTLRHWYTAYERARIAGNVGAEVYQDKIRLLEGWARAIAAKFDPPHVLELTVALREPDTMLVRKYGDAVLDTNGQLQWQVRLDPITKKPLTRIAKRLPATCPICEADVAYNPRTGDMMLPLILEYHDDAEDTVGDSTAICRACEATWTGGVRIRELSWHIEQQEIALNNPQPVAEPVPI